MSIKAIETRYAGCRFRSRLEARWALFFSYMGIAWEYEPQGFAVTHRLTRQLGTFPYLPDFWLPESQTWVEVKASLDTFSALRLLDAAASLSSNDGGGCHDAGGNDLVICGSLTSSRAESVILGGHLALTPLSAPLAGGLPTRLHMHKGDLVASCFFCEWPCSGNTVATDQDGGDTLADIGASEPGIAQLLTGRTCIVHSTNRHILAALDAARTARFEHGERP